MSRQTALWYQWNCFLGWHGGRWTDCCWSTVLTVSAVSLHSVSEHYTLYWADDDSVLDLFTAFLHSTVTRSRCSAVFNKLCNVNKRWRWPWGWSRLFLLQHVGLQGNTVCLSVCLWLWVRSPLLTRIFSYALNTGCRQCVNAVACGTLPSAEEVLTVQPPIVNARIHLFIR